MVSIQNSHRKEQLFKILLHSICLSTSPLHVLRCVSENEGNKVAPVAVLCSHLLQPPGGLGWLLQVLGNSSSCRVLELGETPRGLQMVRASLLWSAEC